MKMYEVLSHSLSLKNGLSHQESKHDHPNRTAEASREALEIQEPADPNCTLLLLLLLGPRRTGRLQSPHPLRLRRRLRRPERRRFVIPTRFLNLPVFVALLDEAEEEFGFQTTGGLALPCDTGFFISILQLLEEDEEKFGGLGLDEFLKTVSEVGLESLDQSSCKESSSSASCHSFTAPLLQNTRV
ncbi:Auxin-responsive protein SAUR32 [Sesamum angolense]|uniref:Auxin-responsive protein SAUR32 n=1 Tax=Sesamum angolense TaxID=2727404 RepID=A0AAE1WEN3_9LAMI|nr:Auxin-responsive protein SAUR32 [Sesamum angolense]